MIITLVKWFDYNTQEIGIIKLCNLLLFLLEMLINLISIYVNIEVYILMWQLNFKIKHFFITSSYFTLILLCVNSILNYYIHDVL